ncbi:polar amino acid transport system substrate-binding protein [Janthinobacterium sp. CG_23.3]|uniref:ABC transporter substrate-binding protein n=1 Tax=unclassified Janthinobacterium TaxID=2610881 RepID=UPI002DFD9BCA|nr:polar amino acid transport system substrate-binding protein [Janthinobacterium sp. CG_S6]
MKTIQCLIAAAAALTVCATAQARTLEQIRKDGKIIIATEGAYPPFNYFEGSKLSGFEIELGEAIMKKAGLKIEWKTLGFDALLSGLRQDRWDAVIDSVGITEERAKAVSFATPYYCSGGVIASKNPAILTVAALNGKVVAVQTGSTYMEQLNKLPGVKVKNFPQDTDARAALLNNRADAWVGDRFAVKAALAKQPDGGMRMGAYLFIEKIAIAVQKGNTQLAGAIDKAQREVVADGTFQALSEKYFQEDIRCK